MALFFLVAGMVMAQKTVINGVAPGAERKMIHLSMYGDLITLQERELASARIDSTGHFSLSADLDQTIGAVLSIDFHKAELLLEPSKTYSVAIAPMNYDEYKEINPFIQSQNLDLELPVDDPTELNNLAGIFNTLYSGFLTEHFNALYRERNKALLDTFRLRINRHFGSAKNPFFLDYAAYKTAGLEQLTQYYNRAQLARKYFTGKPILYQNPEYMDFFNSYYSHYLTSSTGPLRKLDLKALLLTADPYASLMKGMAADTGLKEEPLRELVLLKSMMDIYNSGDFQQENILAVIHAVQQRSKSTGNREVATNMITLLTRLKPGTEAPGFTLLDRDQKDLSLSSLRGKPVVLGFWTTYCETCLNEMDLLRPLVDKYGEKVHFVSVSADKFHTTMLFFINLKKDYTWTFVNIGEHSEVLKEYDVRTYPLFVLIDAEGKINKYPAGLPGNGLEADIQHLLEN